MTASLRWLLGAFVPILAACGADEPQGQWEAVERIKVLAQRDDPMTIAFYVEKGEVCALSKKWHQEKDLRYKEVRCVKGRGWIIDDEYFKKAST